LSGLRTHVVEFVSEATEDPLARRVTKRMLIAALVGIGVLVLAYVAFVLTATGQRLENAALHGANQLGAYQEANALVNLNRISVYSLAAAVTLVFVIGVVRRRMDLAVVGVGVVVVALGITEVLKRYVLVRPDLVQDAQMAHNSFPSGHTTIAMSVLFGLLIVVPCKWRGLTLFISVWYVVGIGEATVTAQWHRLSDTIGADAVALAVACAAMAVIARRSGVTRVELRRFSPRFVFVVLPLGLVVAAELAMGGFIARVAIHDDLSVPTFEWITFLAAQGLAAGFSGLTALVYLGLLRRVSLSPREKVPAATV
jgi:membrane-associated phospholipid phosphatase